MYPDPLADGSQYGPGIASASDNTGSWQAGVACLGAALKFMQLCGVTVLAGPWTRYNHLHLKPQGKVVSDDSTHRQM